MALSPVSLLLLLPLLPLCASEKGCLWGRGVETDPSVGAEIPPCSLQPTWAGGGEKQSNCDLPVPLLVRAWQACPPVLSSVLSGESVQTLNIQQNPSFQRPLKHRLWSYCLTYHPQPLLTVCQNSLGHLKENSFCVLLDKYSQKETKKEKRNSL